MGTRLGRETPTTAVRRMAAWPVPVGGCWERRWGSLRSPLLAPGVTRPYPFQHLPNSPQRARAGNGRVQPTEGWGKALWRVNSFPMWQGGEAPLSCEIGAQWGGGQGAHRTPSPTLGSRVSERVPPFPSLSGGPNKNLTVTMWGAGAQGGAQ